MEAASGALALGGSGVTAAWEGRRRGIIAAWYWCGRGVNVGGGGRGVKGRQCGVGGRGVIVPLEGLQRGVGAA